MIETGVPVSTNSWLSVLKNPEQKEKIFKARSDPHHSTVPVTITITMKSMLACSIRYHFGNSSNT